MAKDAAQIIADYEKEFVAANGRPITITPLKDELVMLEGRGSAISLTELEEMTERLRSRRAA